MCVSCSTDPSAACVNGDLRLFGGTSVYEGTVEVCLDGVWGTVCADFFWNDRAAEIACRQLDFPFDSMWCVRECVELVT